MIIRLPHVDPIDTLDLTEDFENRVKQSFAKYTEGTSKDYRFEDKLQYIENLKKYYIRRVDASEEVRRIILDSCEFALDEYGDLPDRDKFWSLEFMEQIFDAGFLPFRQEYENSSGRNYKTLKAIYEIIRIVVCWEEERE